MFTLALVDDSPISTSNDPNDPEYNPVYIEIDSSDQHPDPSPPAMCLLRLPAGLESVYDSETDSGGATVTFSGTTANYWDITGPLSGDPLSPDTDAWGSSLRIDVENNTASRFWIRARTIFNEVPVDDRSVGLQVVGETKAV